jgi:hypothetical protein
MESFTAALFPARHRALLAAWSQGRCSRESRCARAAMRLIQLLKADAALCDPTEEVANNDVGLVRVMVLGGRVERVPSSSSSSATPAVGGQQQRRMHFRGPSPPPSPNAVSTTTTTTLSAPTVRRGMLTSGLEYVGDGRSRCSSGSSGGGGGTRQSSSYPSYPSSLLQWQGGGGGGGGVCFSEACFAECMVLVDGPELLLTNRRTQALARAVLWEALRQAQQDCTMPHEREVMGVVIVRLEALDGYVRGHFTGCPAKHGEMEERALLGFIGQGMALLARIARDS